MRTRIVAVAWMILVGFGASAASAVPFVLTFEGLQDFEDVLEFYNGGTGSSGSTGPNFGVSFAPAST